MHVQFQSKNEKLSGFRHQGEYGTDIYAGSRILTCLAAYACCAAAAFWGNSAYQAACILIFMLIRVSEALAFGKIGLKILLGGQILKYWELFLPIVWCTCLTGITWILSAVLTGMRKIRLAAVGMAADFILCLVLVRPFILRYEKNGVSFVQIAALSVYIVFMILVCERDIWKRKSD